MRKFISPDNLEKLKKYWDNYEFQNLRSQSKKNHNRNVDDSVGPYLHTCGPVSYTHLTLPTNREV